MRKFWILCFLALPVHAETLAARAVLCDGASDLQAIDAVLTPADRSGKDGAQLLGMIGAHLKFWGGMHHIGELMADEAEKEDQVSTQYHQPTNSGAQMQKAQALMQKAAREQAQSRIILGHCAATDHEQPVRVLERRAIAGYVRVRTAVRGQPAQVWTWARYVLSP